MLSRALGVIEFLANHDGAWSMNAIATELELPRNAVFRIVTTLYSRGYVFKDDQGQFRLSGKILSLGYSAVSGRNLTHEAADLLIKLRDDTGETALLGKLQGDHGLVLDAVLSNEPVKVTVSVGHAFPLHTAAPAKAIISALTVEQRTQLIDRMSFKRYTDRTITTKRAMRQELTEAASAGYAFDRGEEHDEFRCVAAPVFSHKDMPVAAVWVTGPAYRFEDDALDALGKRVRLYANRLSQRLGKCHELESATTIGE